VSACDAVGAGGESWNQIIERRRARVRFVLSRESYDEYGDDEKGDVNAPSTKPAKTGMEWE